MEIEKTVEQVEEKKSQRGAGMVEYAILAAIIVGVAVIARNTLSTAVSRSFSSVAAGVDTAVN